MGQHGRDSGSCSCSRLPHTPLGGEILDDAEGELRVLISNEVHSLFHCFTLSMPPAASTCPGSNRSTFQAGQQRKLS
jgi:hypothetical protein